MTLATRGRLAKIKDELVYYPHQLEGIRELAKRTSFILGDEMGLGKSIQVLTVTGIAFEQGEAKRALLVAPASLKGNWEEEIALHTHFTSHVLSGTQKQRSKQLTAFDADILITNYEQIESHLDELNEMGFDIVIYDEAHYIKSRKSRRTKAVQKLKMPRHFLLTGSPLLNQVDDLWALLNRIDPVEFPTYWRFINRYAVWGGFQDKQIVGIKNEQELRDKLQSRMLRREAKDVLDLPKVNTIVVRLDMSPLQRKLYDQMRDELRVDAPGLDDGELTSANAMTKVLRLKMICASAATVPGHPDESSKLDRAVEMTQELIDSGEPVVVFTQFRQVLELFSERLAKHKIITRQLHGDIPVDARQPIVRDWGNNAKAGKPEVLACMYQVGGVGLNMTAACRMILLDKLYVPEMNRQAIKRIDRIGQERPCTIWELHMRNTVDTRIEAILKSKSDIFATIVGTDNSSWKKKLIAAVLADEDDEP